MENFVPKITKRKNKKFKIIYLTLILIMLLFVGVSSALFTSSSVKGTVPFLTAQSSDITINGPSTINYIDGQPHSRIALEVQLVNPEYGVTDVTWTSSNTSIATVDKFGIVSGVDCGECDITATTVDGKTATQHIIVKNIIQPEITLLSTIEGNSMNQITLTATYTGDATKLYYVAVDAASGYIPSDSASLIDFVLNGTNTNLSNSDYAGAHVARGMVSISDSGTPIDLTGNELGIEGDAGLVGGVKYDIYVVLQYEDDTTKISDMDDLGYYQLAQGFDGGFGDTLAPYQIASADALAHMNYSVYNTNVNLNYELENDIDLSSYANWIPIGSATTPLVGTFDGQGYEVSNLTINNSSATEVGLFGASNGVIKNVGVGGSVTSTNTSATKAGGLVGYVAGGSIIGCYSTASVSVLTNSDSVAGAGGLIGSIGGGTAASPIVISNSHASGTVIGFTDVGGFVGDTMTAPVYVNISECYSTGDVTIITGAGYQIGGFIGRANGNTNIINSYTTSNVTSNGNGIQERTGGFVGWIQDSTNITFCYASGDVSSSNTSGTNAYAGVGGFIGSSAGSTTSAIIRNCLALNNNVTSLLNAKTGKFTGYNITVATFNKDYSNSDMNTNGTATQPSSINPAPGPLPNSSLLLVSFFSTTTNWYNGIAWDTSIWNIVDGACPTLK